MSEGESDGLIVLVVCSHLSRSKGEARIDSVELNACDSFTRVVHMCYCSISYNVFTLCITGTIQVVPQPRCLLAVCHNLRCLLLLLSLL